MNDIPMTLHKLLGSQNPQTGSAPLMPSIRLRVTLKRPPLELSLLPPKENTQALQAFYAPRRLMLELFFASTGSGLQCEELNATAGIFFVTGSTRAWNRFRTMPNALDIAEALLSHEAGFSLQ